VQQDRRSNPYPWTWEPAAVATLAGVGLLALGVQLGRSLALAADGQGWHWPATNQLFSSLPGVLTGHVDSGLTARVPDVSTSSLFGWIGLAELLLALVAATVGQWAWRRWGTSHVVGMATRGDAEQALGITRLHRVRHVVRPDLYPRHHAHRQPRTTP